MTTKPKDGGSAYPCLGNTRHKSDLDLDVVQEGMSLRDYFASQALVGLQLADCLSIAHGDDICTVDEYAKAGATKL